MAIAADLFGRFANHVTTQSRHDTITSRHNHVTTLGGADALACFALERDWHGFADPPQ
jgi:hypothetical protein